MLLLDQTSRAEKLLTGLSRLRWFLAVTFLTAIVVTCLLPRDNWPLLLAPYAIAFVVYAIVLHHRTVIHMRFWLATAIVARIALLFTFPNLSDDIFRFIWDGHLTSAGFNPFSVVPADVLAKGDVVITRGNDLFAMMNSPDYFTVYPPVLQSFFALSSWIGGGNWELSAFILKVVILFAELGTILLLIQYFRHLKAESKVLIYALNPLVIIELVGNIHFEAIMIFGLVLVITTLAATRLPLYKRITGMIAGLFLAIGAKLLPLICVPFLLRRMATKTFIAVCLGAGTLLALSFIPVVMNPSGNGMLSSINLYFQSFEFNASAYYVLRWFGFLWKGYNMIELIGPITAAVTMLMLLSLILFERKPSAANLPVILLFALSSYFFLANVVHPWYVCTLVMLSAFTRYKFAIVWSGLIFLSYSTYQTDAYHENLWFVALEYSIVYGLLIWEIRYTRPLANGLD